MPGKFLAEFELYLMLAIARLGDDAYGAAIRRTIEERTGRPISIGAMYLTLSRLADKNLVTFTVSEPQATKGGRARKYYDLTPAGREATRHSVLMLRRMSNGLRLVHGKEWGP
jgi:PadR family transcriptional regulator PadR